MGSSCAWYDLKKPRRIKHNSLWVVDEVATPTARMLVAKLLFNSIASMKGARFMTMDISNFYHIMPLDRPEYIQIKLSDIPDKIINEYKLLENATKDGSIYIEENKDMCGLPHAGILVNELLKKRLNKHGYRQRKLIPGLWKHDWRPRSVHAGS